MFLSQSVSACLVWLEQRIYIKLAEFSRAFEEDYDWSFMLDLFDSIDD